MGISGSDSTIDITHDTFIAIPESAKKRMTQEQLDLRARCMKLVVDLWGGRGISAEEAIVEAAKIEQYLSGDDSR